MTQVDIMNLVKALNRLVGNRDREFPVGTDPHTVIQHTFERQGINKVLNMLEKLGEGQLKLNDYIQDD